MIERVRRPLDMTQDFERVSTDIAISIAMGNAPAQEIDLKAYQKELIKRLKVERGKAIQRRKLEREGEPIPADLEPVDLSTHHQLLDACIQRLNARQRA